MVNPPIQVATARITSALNDQVPFGVSCLKGRNYPFYKGSKHLEGLEVIPDQIKQAREYKLACFFILVGENGLEPS
jgi:hypothetical protein